MLPAMLIFSFTIMTYFKTFIGTKFLNRKQCPAGLSPKIIPSLPEPPPPPHALLPKNSKIKWF